MVDNEYALREALTPDGVGDELARIVNLDELAKRQFRSIARVAGLVFAGYPGRGKSSRQLQASSGLVYDVFARHDPENALLAQARREVYEDLLNVPRILSVLTDIAVAVSAPDPSRAPLAFRVRPVGRAHAYADGVVRRLGNAGAPHGRTVARESATVTDTLEVSVNGLDAVLHAQGAVFIPSRRCLLVADIHLGKASFFAANGIGLPSGDTDHDLKRLTQLCERFGCNRIVSLGDLAHSAPRPGERWPEQLAAMLAARPLLRIDSVVGNHDRNVVSKVRVPGLRWHREVDLDGALCVHDRDCESVDRERRPVFSGHLHPGIVLPGRSRLRLPGVLASP